MDRGDATTATAGHREEGPGRDKAKRPQIEALYTDDVGKLMGGSSGYALRFLGGFFNDIENERKVQKDIIEKCAPAR